MLHEYLAGLFSSQRTPDLFGDASTVLSRRESKALVDRIAHAIHDRTAALARPASIAIHLPRTNQYLATIFAAWQAGHHYVPLNQAWPDAHTRQILDDAQPDLIVTDTPGFDDVAPVLSIDDATCYPIPSADMHRAWDAAAAQPGTAYVIYTSGSTGGQKGVVISKGALTAYVDWVHRVLGAHRGNQRLLINGEMSFDISIADLAFALAFETEIHISPSAKNMLAHARLLRDRGIDTFYAVPSTINRLFSWARTRKDLRFEHLKTVFSGGDVLTYGLVDLVRQVAPDARCYNMYGPTEVTMNCLYFPIPQHHEGSGKQGPVPTGMAFDHLTYLLVDPDTLTPAEHDGELLVAGSQCMDGYLRDPARTAAAFVEVSGDRYYRTGDLFERDADGVYSIVGRVDSLVKVKGYRVNTTVVDSLLMGADWVQDARAVVVPQGDGDAAIVAFLAVRAAPESGEEVLKQRCASELPHYMVPIRFIFLDQLPHGTTGKVDVAKLREMALEHQTAS